LNFINNRFIQWTLDRGCLLFHAAGVAPARSRPGPGRVLGHGKSNPGLARHEPRLDFVSNDRLMCAKTAR
jgi:hypothetical protein